MFQTLLLRSALGGALATGIAGAADRTFRSDPARVTLIELYTSEGCSSCPTAERWLGELRDAAGLWRDFVPVAFHVNYWDHLGWRDTLANAAFTARQHAYAAAWRADSVYTPGFVRNGAEWRPRDGAVSAENPPDAGELTLHWDSAARDCTVIFLPASAAPPAAAYEVTVALQGGGIVHPIRRGENAGRELRHDFVALRLVTIPLRRQADGSWQASVSLPPRADLQPRRESLAAWISRPGTLAPLQAAGGWIDPEENAAGPITRQPGG